MEAEFRGIPFLLEKNDNHQRNDIDPLLSKGCLLSVLFIYLKKTRNSALLEKISFTSK